MCGIAGIINWRGRPVDLAGLDKILGLLAHRGPDGNGVWTSARGDVALGHRRLAILDVSEAGRQPMTSPDGRYTITYNGEIFNFIEIREELERVGHSFRGQSDTEVLLAAWASWGEDMLLRLNGMWAFAIHDNLTRSTFLARDRFGIKPLLYASTPRGVVFASEQRALLRSGLIDVTIDLALARRILVEPFGIEGSDRTIFRSISRLPAGHCARVAEGRVQIRRWWRTVDHLVEVPATEEARAERFRELFLDAVRLRMRSDVPLGTSLSGGFDSTAVVCAMAEMARRDGEARRAASWQHAFIASFRGSDIDERPQAEMAARHAGVVPHVLEVEGADALPNIERVLDDNDDIYIEPSVAPWLVYREQRRRGVVVTLDGHGADELLGGYRQGGASLSFALRNALAGLASRSATLRRVGGVLRAGAFALGGKSFVNGVARIAPKALSLVGEGDALPREWGPFNRRLYGMFHGTLLPTILRNFDRLSMAHGIEVRMPFLDWRLVCYAMSLPDASKVSETGLSKAVARQAVKGLVPEAIRTNPRKIGFASPLPAWLNGPLRDWVRALLEERCDEFGELVDERRLRARVDQLTGDRAWDWSSAHRVWPYLQLRWLLLRNASIAVSAEPVSGRDHTTAALSGRGVATGEHAGAVPAHFTSGVQG